MSFFLIIGLGAVFPFEDVSIRVVLKDTYVL